VGQFGALYAVIPQACPARSVRERRVAARVGISLHCRVAIPVYIVYFTTFVRDGTSPSAWSADPDTRPLRGLRRDDSGNVTHYQGASLIAATRDTDSE
jgi:hypothetical protein